MFTKEQYKTPDYFIPVMDITAWSGFTNQPSNDGIEVVSDDAGDTGKVTIWGTDNTTGDTTFETVTLDGTTAVATTKTDWGKMYGAFMGDVFGKNISEAVGTITFREASGDMSITTIAAAKISTGLIGFDLSGRMVTLENLSGNTYIHFSEAPTTTTGYQVEDKLDLSITQYLYLISDNSSSTCEIMVWKTS